MEKEKPLPLKALIGVALTMLSLAVVFGLDSVISRESSAAYSYRSQPLANLAALIVLVVGIILMYTGLEN